MPSRRRVLIGTPTLDGKVDHEYVHALLGTDRLLAQDGIVMREAFVKGAIVQYARNALVALALRDGFDDLVMIDADQDWKPEWVPRLLDYPVNCVGAPVRLKTDEERYNVRAPSPDLEEGPDTGHGSRLLAVETLGTGFIRYSRTALQALWDRSQPYRAEDGTDSRWIFDIRPVDGTLLGEDSMASYKLDACGIKVWIDPTMTCGHIGRKRYTGDFAGYLKRLKAGVAKREAA